MRRHLPQGPQLPTRAFRPAAQRGRRLALGAEARNRYALGRTIVPAGIVFGAREFLLSAVVLRLTSPIRVADYAELHRADPERAVEAPVRERLLQLRMTLYAVAPVSLLGAAHNVVPYLVTRGLARRFREDAVRAFAYFAIGVIAFALTYLVTTLALWHLSAMSAPFIALYLLALPPTGLAALSYRGKVVRYRDKIALRTFLWHHNDWAEVLARERRALLTDFQRLAERQLGASS